LEEEGGKPLIPSSTIVGLRAGLFQMQFDSAVDFSRDFIVLFRLHASHAPNCSVADIKKSVAAWRAALRSFCPICVDYG